LGRSDQQGRARRSQSGPPKSWTRPVVLGRWRCHPLVRSQRMVKPFTHGASVGAWCSLTSEWMRCCDEVDLCPPRRGCCCGASPIICVGSVLISVTSRLCESLASTRTVHWKRCLCLTCSLSRHWHKRPIPDCHTALPIAAKYISVRGNASVNPGGEGDVGGDGTNAAIAKADHHDRVAGLSDGCVATRD